MTNPNVRSFTAFDGWQRIASGTLQATVLAVKHAAEAGAPGPLLIFDDRTGRVEDIDTRGSDADTLARLPPEAPGGETGDHDPYGMPPATPQQRGRGRPKLGVTAREVTLLPRHWDWLSAQPGGASVALRKLVDEARRRGAGSEEGRVARERAYRFMSAMAGDLPGFEDSTRALFAGDTGTFLELIAAWPGDVRDYAIRLASSPTPEGQAGQDKHDE